MTAACPPRFASRFEAFSAIGATGDGGVHRMEATEANGEARRQLVDLAEGRRLCGADRPCRQHFWLARTRRA